MPTGFGFKIKFGYRREAVVYAPTWPGTAIAVNKLLPVLPGTDLDEVPQLEPDQSLDGKASTRAHDLVGWTVGGRRPARLQYEGLEELWLAALGYMPFRKGGSPSGVTMPELIAAGVSKHLFEIGDNPEDEGWLAGEGGWKAGDPLTAGQIKVRRLTLAEDEQVAVSEYRSIRIARLSLRIQVTGVSLEVETVGYDRNLASAVNTAGVIGALSLNAAPYALFSQLAVRLGAFSTGTPLGSGDVIKIDEAEITLENNLVRDQRDSVTALRIVEPVRSGKLSVHVRLHLPRFTALTHRDRLAALTIGMADLKFTGGTIPGTAQTYQCNVYLPRLVPSAAPVPVADAGPLMQTLEFEGQAVTGAAPAGFPSNEKNGPFMIETQNGNSAHALL